VQQFTRPREARPGSSTGNIRFLLKLDEQRGYRSADGDDGIAHLARAVSILRTAEHVIKETGEG
jgi:hypothetical protein